MTEKIRTIGVCNGGGDCPGLNAVIRAVVRSAINKYHWEVTGILDGFDGLIYGGERLRPLSIDDVTGILSRGGTILGTTNRGNPFHYKTVENGVEVVQDVSDRVIDNARKAGIDAVVLIGGDGTMKIGLDLFHKGMAVVGVPKTIDNDLDATDITFGFDTALHTATDAIDKIHTTAESHHRIMVVEVMGHDAGWIALQAGIAGAASVILIPEIPFKIDNVVSFIRDREHEGNRYSIVVVAEGVKPKDMVQPVFDRERRELPRGGPGNLIGDTLAIALKRETRVTVLGHIQRGGSPSPFDRILSTRFGVEAVEAVARGEFGKMVCLRGTSVKTVDIAEAVGRLKTVDPNDELVQVAKAIGICFGD